MKLHRAAVPCALAVASAVVLAGLSQALAQFPPPPGQSSQPAGASPFPPPPGQNNPFPPPPSQSSPFPPPPGQASAPGSSPFPGPPSVRSGAPAGGRLSPFAPPGSAPAASSPCESFVALRQDAEKNAAAIKAAGDRKATREEVCPLFQRFVASEAKMVKFMETNQQLCGVPPEAVKQVKGNHGRSTQMRNQICSAGPSAPRGPSLSDAFGGSVVAPAEAPKPGRGTFDTLTGPIRR